MPDLQRRWAGPHLVLVPSDLVRDGPWVKDWEAVVPPWDSRLSTWKPGIPAHTCGLWPIPTLDHLPLRHLKPGDVAVMTYHTLLHRQDQVASIPWQVIVADEVHRLKNPHAAWTQAAYRLSSTFRIGMSATPFTNYVHELREVLAWIQGWTVGDRRVSSIWPDSDHWRENFCAWDYVPTERGPYRRVPAGALYPDYLYNWLRAEVLFSATTDEVSDAPDPIIHPLPIPLSSKQAQVYADLKKGVLQWVAKGRIEALDTGPVIAQFAYLFQLCADARQLELSIAHTRNSDNILPHSGIRPTFSKGWAWADQSSKLKALLWVLDKAAKGEQVLVLTGYARLAKLLTSDLLRLGYKVEAITGDTKDRSSVVSHFAAGTTRIVVCTRAAWEGIGLRAPFAVLYGFVDYTPGIVKQALMRAWSMADTAPVVVYDIYAPGTVEEWNRQRLAAKDRFSSVMTNGQEKPTFTSVEDISAALDGKFTG